MDDESLSRSRSVRTMRQMKTQGRRHEGSMVSHVSHIVWQYYPLNNVVCIHMYDECEKSIDSGVCHRPWTIS